MLKIYVDFNALERPNFVILRPGPAVGKHAALLESGLKVGDEVMLYDDTLECIATVQKGEYYPLVAEMKIDTIINHLEQKD